MATAELPTDSDFEVTEGDMVSKLIASLHTQILSGICSTSERSIYSTSDTRKAINSYLTQRASRGARRQLNPAESRRDGEKRSQFLWNRGCLIFGTM